MAPVLYRHKSGLPDSHLVLLRQYPPILQVGPAAWGAGGGRRGKGGLTVMPLEDRWLGLSPGGWERDDGSQGSIWGLALQILPNSEPRVSSLLLSVPGEGSGHWTQGMGWSLAPPTQPCVLECACSPRVDATQGSNAASSSPLSLSWRQC